ncbi:unnamed protein product [marine sediment metagenome]|uniref:YrdC-like domain-containing protein n=1 Tax=marine sediment metagenome TaxID=412755 RepID=X1EEQ5_9ZZZZ
MWKAEKTPTKNSGNEVAKAIKSEATINSLMIKINPQKLDKNVIQKVAKIIKRGRLIAFPTETV